MAKIIIHEAMGQLGNCLYRLANLIAFAQENDFDIYDLSFSSSGYASGFEKTYRQPLIRYPSRCSLPVSAYIIQKHVRKIFRYMVRSGFISLMEIRDEQQQFDLDRLKDIHLKRGAIALHGVHFQADKLVQKHAGYLRNYLVPRRKIQRSVEAFHRQMRQDADIVVGVHIRLGDFKEWMGGRFFFSVETYVRIMREFLMHMGEKSVKFIVFANGNETVEHHDYSELDVQFACGSPVEDIYHLSLCDLLIGTMYSTFSGWASFFGEVPLLRIHRNDQPFCMDDFNVISVLNNTFSYHGIE